MEGPSNKGEKVEAYKENEVTAEFALSDALDNVCQYLKIKDLISVALVCKSWYGTASREMEKRGPERILLPHIYSKEITDKNSNFHVYDLLRAKPHIAFLFIGPSQRERSNRRLEIEVLAAYKKHFPNTLVAVGVDECMMDEEVIVSCPGLLGPPNGILGFFLPLYRNLKIKTAHLSNIPKQPGYIFKHAADKIVEDLFPGNKETKSTIIMFCNSHTSYCNGYSIAEGMMKLIRIKFIQKNYTLWGGIFDDELKGLCNEDSTDDYAIFAINILGSTVESWSTIVDCRITKHEVDKKLLELKDNLKLRRSTIGLVCGPRYVEDLSKSSSEDMYVNSHELMNAVKKIFPDIPFISIFNYGYLSHFGVNSSSDDCHQNLAYQMAMSLMILSYD